MNLLKVAEFIVEEGDLDVDPHMINLKPFDVSYLEKIKRFYQGPGIQSFGLYELSKYPVYEDEIGDIEKEWFYKSAYECPLNVAMENPELEIVNTVAHEMMHLYQVIRDFSDSPMLMFYTWFEQLLSSDHQYNKIPMEIEANEFGSEMEKKYLAKYSIDTFSTLNFENFPFSDE